MILIWASPENPLLTQKGGIDHEKEKSICPLDDPCDPFRGCPLGVGLEFEESPLPAGHAFFHGEKESPPLQANGVIAVGNCGLYLSGFGVRVEDTVVVTEKGPRVLTEYPYHLEKWNFKGANFRSYLSLAATISSKVCKEEFLYRQGPLIGYHFMV